MSVMVDHTLISPEIADEYHRVHTERTRLRAALCVKDENFPGVKSAGRLFCLRRLAPMAALLLVVVAAFRFDLTVSILAATAAALGTVLTVSWWNKRAKRRWITQQRCALSRQFGALDNDVAHLVKALSFAVHEAGLGDLVPGAMEAYRLVEQRRAHIGPDTNTGPMAAHSKSELGKEDIDRLYLVSADGNWTPMRIVDNGTTIELRPR